MATATLERSSLRTLGGMIYFDGGPEGLFPDGRVSYVDEWLPILEFEDGFVTYFYRLREHTFRTGGKYLTYVYSGSRRTPGTGVEEDA